MGVFHEGGRRRRTPLIATIGLVAVALAAAVGASLAQRSPHAVVVNPAPIPGVVSVAVLQAPPSNVPLLWFRDDSTGLPFVLRATDWNGKTVGRLAVSCSSCGLLASPDGQRLLLGSQSAPGVRPDDDRVFTATGTALSAVDGFRAQWSDDSRHLCTVRARAGSAANEADLSVVDVAGGRTRHVATLTMTAGPPSGGGWTISGCAIGADRAVAVFARDTVRAVRAVQLSTGRTVLSIDPAPGATCACQIGSIAVSGNGLVGAANPAQGGDAQALDLRGGTASPTPPAWRGRGPVLGLSWDGRLAVTPVGVYAFPGGAAVWQAPLPAYLVPMSARPRAGDVLLSVWESSGTAGRSIVVRGDGSSTGIGGAQLAPPPLLPY